MSPSASGGGRASEPLAAQHGANAGRQLARVEGLGDVVIGAELETQDAVDVVAAGGEHDHGQVAVGAQPPQHVEAAGLGQHDIQQQELRPAGQHLVEGPFDRAGGRYVEAVFAQILGQKLRELGVIIEQQDADRRCAHLATR